MCVLLNNYEALDFLESQAGRVAFKLPIRMSRWRGSLLPFPT